MCSMHKVLRNIIGKKISLDYMCVCVCACCATECYCKYARKSERQIVNLQQQICFSAKMNDDNKLLSVFHLLLLHNQISGVVVVVVVVGGCVYVNQIENKIQPQRGLLTF